MDEFEKCKIERNDELGRYVTAAVDIKAGETILQESPVLILPLKGDKRCSNCFKLAQAFCSTCKLFPLCDKCGQHSDCAFLSQLHDKVDVGVVQKHSQVYGPMKSLLMGANAETSKYFEAMMEMEAHLEERRNTDIWSDHNENAVSPLMNSGLTEHLQVGGRKIDGELIQQICGVVDVNCFEIRAPDVDSMRAVYIRGALLSHSCIANTVISIDNQYQIKIYANRAIAAGEIISICYTNILLGTDERRELLKIGKYFICKCERCEDPTELGSHMSSFLCNPCLANRRPGAIVQKAHNKWQCVVCDHVLPPSHVATVLERAKEEIFHAKDDIYRYEMLMAKLVRILHRNHYLLIDLKQNIAAILRAIIQNLAHRPGRKVYERKVALCREILQTLHVIQPGISRLKAIAMYELCNSAAELSRLRFQEEDLTEPELLIELKESEIILRESVRMLLYEPTDSPEGKLAKEMMKELKDLQNDIKVLQVNIQ